MPYIDSTLFAASPSRSAFITGMPPPTLASKPMSTPFSAALVNISFPCVERSALLAVTTCLPRSRASIMKSLAMPVPPTSSITTDISGSFMISLASVVRTPSSTLMPLSRLTSLSAIFLRTISHPSLLLMTEAFSFKTFTTPVPTVPKPMSPTFIARSAMESFMTAFSFSEVIIR